MPDLLDTLTAAQGINDSLPIKTLVTWFLNDCKAKNLQPRTILFYRQKLIYLTEAAGDRAAASITTQQLKMLVQHFREKREWSTGMTNHFITALKVFYNFLEREELITVNPARRLSKLKGEQRIPEPLTPDEIKALLADAGDGFVGIRNSTMMLILLDCGLRLSELMGIKVSDVDFALCQIKVFGKGRKERIVPFSGPVRRSLLKYITYRHARVHNEDALWVDDQGIPMTPSGFKSFIVRLEKRTGIRVHAHKFRHTYATFYVRNGGNPAYLQRLLGHVTPMMTQRYTHLADTDAKDDHRLASPVTNLLGPRWKR